MSECDNIYNKIKTATAWNNHGEARQMMAEAFHLDMFEKKFKLMNELCRLYGHTPHEILHLSNRLTDEMLVAIHKEYGDTALTQCMNSI